MFFPPHLLYHKHTTHTTFYKEEFDTKKTAVKRFLLILYCSNCQRPDWRKKASKSISRRSIFRTAKML